jgi:DNA repair exonuclease SbcCD ATPase subunit
MFKAIARWFKAFGYLLTGQIDAARRTLDTNPHVVRAKYDEVIREKTSRIQQYKQAVAGLIAQQENKIAKVKNLTEEVQRLQRLKAGALAKAKQLVQKMQDQGKSKEEIQADGEYQKCLTAYNDFSSTLAEKNERITELETDIGSYSTRIQEHKVQLQHLLREIEKVKSEASDAVADIITAKQEQELADAFAGIAEDGTARELQELRQLRQEVKAEARISKELAGTDSRAQEIEFLEYARKSSVNEEFDALVGLAEEKDTSATPEEKAGPDEEKTSSLPE